MPTRFEAYRMRDGVTPLAEDYFNPVLADIDARIAELESRRADLQGVIDELTAFGLQRIDVLIGPAIAQTQATLDALQELRADLEAAIAAADIKMTAFGLGGAAAPVPGNNIDDNTIPTGFYYVQPTTSGTKPAGDDGYGHLIVSREGGGTTARQLYLDNTTNRIWTRTWEPSQWSGWVEIYHSGNISSANAGTATKLQTARTITIGNTGRSFDGSANVSWTLAEVIGNRITGDFSNATPTNRVLFQTSTPNENTAVGAIPNGTGNTASFVAWNGSDASNASFAQIVAGTDARLISGATGTGTLLPMTFWTGGAERMRIGTSGNVLVTNNTGGLGYGPGAGGSVTQSTSKSTAVTLNRPTGQITMNNAALAAGASVLFTLNNSVILFNDLLLMGTTGGGNYRVDCVDVFNGAAAIRVTNISAGSLSDALVIRFAVIRGVVA